MAFKIPTFNLTCNVWRNALAPAPYATPDLALPCNLTPGKRVFTPLSATVFAFRYPMELLLPVGSDVRAMWNGANQDLIEVPAGSKRFYSVLWVDDVAKGFANEYRVAVIGYQVTGGANFAPPIAAPVPLP
ncbi:MAG: hypothetical protein HRJ53_19730 [Acidobacteria bacterium Pan2503]|uniref:Uncharacterized protein n=1 Tax=Candidatus Acidiferrum panamense TaxID=2741543 RepID=A0A7V8NTZ8_9BACT|nr:hypothetical protein [Candidatus Acidoferrum panamensis]